MSSQKLRRQQILNAALSNRALLQSSRGLTAHYIRQHSSENLRCFQETHHRQVASSASSTAKRRRGVIRRTPVSLKTLCVRSVSNCLREALDTSYNPKLIETLRAYLESKKPTPALVGEIMSAVSVDRIWEPPTAFEMDLDPFLPLLECLPSTGMCRFRYVVRPFQTTLVCKILRNLTNLREVSLKLTCTNKLIGVLSANCPHLESLDVSESPEVTDEGARRLILNSKFWHKNKWLCALNKIKDFPPTRQNSLRRLTKFEGEDVGAEHFNPCVQTLVRVNVCETKMSDLAVEFLRIKLGRKCTISY
ncbi:unnamed protein product [Cyprideis torosa]|uniref:Uncharacterized protein n=1 Tax=Cyprideis torosa TaxID=163714 RepID=A0A7R8WSC6_9CRUS|nr:unnamed protein product [Cyprideis torosa]CAG0905000.1 unnamed protein product [Cyprideis torosa]